MAVVSGGGIFNPGITQIATLGVAANTSLQGAVLSMRSQFANGSLADQLLNVQPFQYILAASTPQTINLQSLVDQIGNPFSLSVVRVFFYRIVSSNPAFTVTVGGAGTNEWNGVLTSGSKMIWYPSSLTNDGFSWMQMPSLTGAPVTSTSRLFKLDPGSNAVGEVDIIIAGS